MPPVEEQSLELLHSDTYDSRLYQIDQPTRAKKVMVEERLDSSIHITYKGQDLRFREIAERPCRKKRRSPIMVHEKRPKRPANNHPWRRAIFLKRRQKGQLVTAP